ncbi:unnamed protein product [Gadus morhua 'NCC']
MSCTLLKGFPISSHTMVQRSMTFWTKLKWKASGLKWQPGNISLALEGTLSSIMTIKMADLEPCFKWEPPSDVIKASKKATATGQYNRAHRS